MAALGKGVVMSAQPSLAIKTGPRTGHFLSPCPAAGILVIFLLWTGNSYASVTNQFIRVFTYPTGGTPTQIVSSDFNRDGKADVVALNSNTLNSNGVLSILLGTGNGGFASPKTITTLSTVFQSSTPLLFTADFNGDGNPDLLVFPSPGKVVEVFLGRGDGTFAAPVSIGVGFAFNLAIGDFNGDGRPDIAVTGSSSIAVLLGISGGIFDKPI